MQQVIKTICRWSWAFVLCWIALGSTLAEAQPFAYVTNVNSNNVSVIDTSTNTEVLPRIPVGPFPFAVAITPDGAFAYVANHGDDSVSVIDTSTNTEVLPGIRPLGGPSAVAITPDGAFAYVANRASNNVSVIDTSTNTEVLPRISVGTSPTSVAITPVTDTPMEPTLVFLHGSGPNANPAVLFLDRVAPTSSTAKYRDSAAIKFSGGNPWKTIGTWEAGPAFTSGTVNVLGDLSVWLGLKNSDDTGTRFDLAVEVWKNGNLVAEGETLCITGVTRNPSLAKEVTVSFQPFSPTTFNGSSDVLSLKLLTRIGTNGSGGFCGGHSSATGLRLYFDAVDRDAGFGVNSN
jgi:YVTN family beta-propeller protein